MQNNHIQHIVADAPNADVKRWRQDMKKIAQIIMLVALTHFNVSGQDLEGSFLNPPDSAKPWVFWYWMQANATRDGITRDLEAMAETGIGGAMLMPIGQVRPQRPHSVQFSKTAW